MIGNKEEIGCYVTLVTMDTITTGTAYREKLISVVTHIRLISYFSYQNTVQLHLYCDHIHECR